MSARVLLAVAGLAATALPACTSVKMTYRDQCWVRRTESFGGKVVEAVGPCTRPAPNWSSDPYLRLVQECVAESDYRWQNLALDAWSHHEQIPAEPDRQSLLEKCLDIAAQHLAANDAVRRENEAIKGENAALRGEKVALERRVEDLSTMMSESAEKADELYEKSSERADEMYQRFAQRSDQMFSTLADHAGRTWDRMAATNDKLAGYLGEAAKKPAGTAIATATAKGEGSTKNDNASRNDNQNDSRTQASTSERSERRDSRPRALPPAAAPRPSSLHVPATAPQCPPTEACAPATPAGPATPPEAAPQTAAGEAAHDAPVAGEPARASCEGPGCAPGPAAADGK